MAGTRQRGKLWRVKLISLAVASCFAREAVYANPTGPVVVNGQVTFHQQGNLLQVTNSPGSIINWQSFSIGTNELTRFLQQSPSSAVLNRVVTRDPSSILGALQSNGRVFLINPNGILFGAGAQIDVAGLVASTLKMSDADFLAGRMRFTEVAGAGSVINQGAINTAQGGQVYLVGPAVTNQGIITSPKGEVILAAGNRVELVDPGTPNLRVEITAPDNQAVNLGQIVADAGRVGIHAGLINQAGTIRADSAVVTEEGRIVLKATKGITLESGSLTAASGVKGGNVAVETETGTIRVAGQIDATGSEAGGAISIGVAGATGGIDLGSGLNAGNASVNLRGSGQTTTLNADIITAGADITINDSVILGVPAMITLDTTGGGAAGANITIAGTTNDDGTPSGLVLRAGTVGANTLGGAVGNMVPIASLTTSGNATAINGGLVNTTGNQTYNGPVTLGAATTLSATAPTASIAINNSLFGPNNLTINSGNNLVIAGNVSTGPQAITIGGGLIVRSSPTGPALLQATGGQTINARSIEVTAQNDNAAGIFNATSGDQVITVAGGGSSPGIDVRSLANGGQAFIGNNATGASQVITVTDADHINVDGFGPSQLSNVSAIISSSGIQTISITGSGSNAINVGSAGAQDGSVINARSQTITAGTGNQSGSITIVGPAVNGSGAGLLTNAGAGTQTISTSGALNITGGAAPAQLSTNPSGIGHNSSGPQAVTAESITLQGGLTGSLNGVSIRSAGGGDQTITASQIAIAGGTGTNNFALIERTAGGSGHQTVNVNGGSISLQGGSGGGGNVARIRNDGSGTQTISGSPTITITGGSGGVLDLGSQAQIRAVGHQVISAGPTTLTAGPSGFNNLAGIHSPDQDITIHGNLTLTGGGSISGATSTTDARIGGLAGAAPTPTNLVLVVEGNVTMNGGTVPNASPVIGSSFTGGQPTDITMMVGGNLTMNPGTVSFSGSRIGSPSAGISGGNIAISAGGNITMNSSIAPGTLGTVIRTLGDVTLDANSITIGGSVLSGAQTINAAGNITVAAGGVGNAVASATGPQLITAGGALTVQGGTGTGLSAQILGSAGQTISASSVNVTGGSGTNSFAEIYQTGLAGSQSVDASSITIIGGSGGANNFARIRNDGTGAQTINVAGPLNLVGGTGGVADSGNFAQIRAVGPQIITAGNTAIVGGPSGFSNFAGIHSPDQDITVRGDLALTGGGSVTGLTSAGGARIGGIGGAVVGLTDLMLTVDGNATMTGGSQENSGAVIGSAFQGGQPTDITMMVGGNLTMNPGTVANSGSRIGSPGAGIAGGNISIEAGGNITMNGSIAPGTLGTVIRTAGNASLDANSITIGGSVLSGGQTINAAGNLTVAASGVGNAVASATGPQSITAGGALTVQGGAGSGQSAQILGSSGQTISASDIAVIGGSGANSLAEIRQTGLAAGQAITASDSFTIVGGPSGTNNFARVRNDGTGAQTINVTGPLNLAGGTGGASDAGNFAQIRSVGPQVITAGPTLIMAGPSGFNNFANISGPDQDITIHGNLTLVGGGSSTSATSGADARIGGSGAGGGTPTATSLTLVVDGNVTMLGGTATNAGATIGSQFLGGERTDITMNVGGNLFLGTGTASLSSARIGSPNTNVAGGNISITAGGNITLDSATVVGTRSVIRTLDSLLLDANNITVGGSLFSGAQAINAAGDFTVAAPNAVNALVTATGPQTITAGGALTVRGGAGTGLSAQILGATGQTISSSSVNVIGGSGTGSFAEILQTGLEKSQSIDASSMTIIGGSGGPNNFARIRNDGIAAQTINVTGPLSLVGGTGGVADSGNFAQIRAIGPQVITAGETAIVAGPSGFSNFAGIHSPDQDITVHGNLTLNGGGSVTGPTSAGGARIGGIGGAVVGPTNLTLTVDGSTTMTGGSQENAGAVIGSAFQGGQPTDITMMVGGNLTMNPGSVANSGSRIGGVSGNLAGGDISIAAGGNITMNSSVTPGTLGSVIRTRDDVTLDAKAIVQGQTARIQAESLVTHTADGTRLTGSNQIAVFNATNATSGDVALNNTSPLLTVTGVSQVPTGSFTLNQIGDLAITRNVFSGPQSISATGDMVVGANGNPVILYAADPQSVSVSGMPNATLFGLGVGLLDRLAGHGAVNISARSLSVRGGSELGSFAAITGGPISITTTGDLATGNLSITGGSGPGSFGWVLSSQDIDLTVGGNLTLNAGTGLLSFARMQTVRPTSVINVYFPNLSEGGYFVNGIEGAYRDGLTGFFAGPAAAKPGKRLITTYGQE